MASHVRFAAMSTNSAHRVIDGASHQELLGNEKGSAATSHAVLDVVAAIRIATPLARLHRTVNARRRCFAATCRAGSLADSVGSWAARRRATPHEDDAQPDRHGAPPSCIGQRHAAEWNTAAITTPPAMIDQVPQSRSNRCLLLQTEGSGPPPALQ